MLKWFIASIVLFLGTIIVGYTKTGWDRSNWLLIAFGLLIDIIIPINMIMIINDEWSRIFNKFWDWRDEK